MNMWNVKCDDLDSSIIKFQKFIGNRSIIQKIVFTLYLFRTGSGEILQIVVSRQIIFKKNLKNDLTAIATKVFFVKNNCISFTGITAMETSRNIGHLNFLLRANLWFQKDL